MKIKEVLDPPKYVYHGTSTKELDKLRKNGYVARNLYVGEDIDNITAHYAEQQAMHDDSEPVILKLDSTKLPELQQDYHYDDGSGYEELGYKIGEDGSVEQPGQYYFSGEFKDAIVEILEW